MQLLMHAGDGLTHCSWHAAEKRARQLAGTGMVKCMAFGGEGRLLALGGEDGSLVVLDWFTLRPRIELRRAAVSLWGSCSLLPGAQ